MSDAAHRTWMTEPLSIGTLHWSRRDSTYIPPNMRPIIPRLRRVRRKVMKRKPVRRCDP